MLKSSSHILFAITIIILVPLFLWWSSHSNNTFNWSADEIQILESLSLNKLPPLPKDHSNAVADNLRAAEFGKHLFFDERFSYNSKISCATCHIPKLYFTDGLITAVGAKTGVRNSPTLVGTAYSPWQFWDGRSDSQWSQALAPLENDLEHAASRAQFSHIIYADKNYRTCYEELFGPMPDITDKNRFPTAAAPVDDKELNDAWQAMTKDDQNAITNIFVNIAKAIAAYERLLQPGTSRFDNYVEGIINNDSKNLKLLNKNEILGLRLFIGKAQCINCHNGPLFSNNEFHNTGILSAARQLPSLGRANGVRLVLADPFNCQGEYSAAKNGQCDNLRFVKLGDELIAAHKVPTLRNVSETAPYMHAGQIDTLEDVITHYNQAPEAMVGHNEIKPLNLNYIERRQLVAFLNSLSAPLATNPQWLTP